MKLILEKKVKELLGQQRAICQRDFEKGINNVLFSETPKLKEFVTIKKDSVKLLKQTLKQKELVYKDICDWFKKDCDSSTSDDTISEYEKNATAVDAQIKLLRYLLYENES